MKKWVFYSPVKAAGFLPGGRQEVRGWAGRRSLIRRRRGELIERRHRRWLGSWLTATRCLHQTWRGVEWVWEGRWGSTCSPTLAMVTGLPLHPHRCQRRSGISFPPAAHLWAVYERWTGVGAGIWLTEIHLCCCFIFFLMFLLRWWGWRLLCWLCALRYFCGFPLFCCFFKHFF